MVGVPSRDASAPVRTIVFMSSHPLSGLDGRGGSIAAPDAARNRIVSDVLDVPVVRLDQDLPLPAYARPGDAGADLVAREGAVLKAGGGRAAVPTGIALALPEGYGGFVQPRSGLAMKHGVTVLNSPGLIDAGYRDEVRVLLVNLDPSEDYEVRRGDRIAQLVIQRVESASFAAVAELPASERGLGGFGHSGR
jgi:dUTP pyrophosphatase